MVEMHVCEINGRQSETCERGGFWSWRAVVESVVYLEREGGADISKRER